MARFLIGYPYHRKTSVHTCLHDYLLVRATLARLWNQSVLQEMRRKPNPSQTPRTWMETTESMSYQALSTTQALSMPLTGTTH